MTDWSISDEELRAWLDEALPDLKMSHIEQLLRTTPELRIRLANLISERDQGTITVGEVWRRHQLSCPTRHELGSFLLNALVEAHARYVRFHLETVGCRKCQASLRDLQDSQATSNASNERQQRVFASSVGHLRSNPSSGGDS